MSYPCFELTRPLSPAVSSKSTLHHTACAHQLSDIPTNDEFTPMTLYRNRGSYFRASANFGYPAFEGFSATKTREKQKDSGTLTGYKVDRRLRKHHISVCIHSTLREPVRTLHCGAGSLLKCWAGIYSPSFFTTYLISRTIPYIDQERSKVK